MEKAVKNHQNLYLQSVIIIQHADSKLKLLFFIYLFYFVVSNIYLKTLEVCLSYKIYE